MIEGNYATAWQRVATTASLAVWLGVVTGCVTEGGVHDEEGPVYHPAPPRYPAEAVEIPPGHMPPPGECRIWFPDRPPGQQPPPGPCRQLQFEVPPGAVLVRG